MEGAAKQSRGEKEVAKSKFLVEATLVGGGNRVPPPLSYPYSITE